MGVFFVSGTDFRFIPQSRSYFSRPAKGLPSGREFTRIYPPGRFRCAMRNTCFREWHPPEFFVFTQHGFRFVWRFRRPCWNAIPLARQPPFRRCTGPRFRRLRRVRVTRFSQVVRRPSLGLQLGLRALECHSSSTRMRSAPPHPIPFYEHEP